MKTLRQFLTEESETEISFETQAKEVEKTLADEVIKILGNGYEILELRTDFYRSPESIILMIINKERLHGSWQNEPGLMRFSMYYRENGYKWETAWLNRKLNKQHFSSDISVRDATNKLLSWLKNNKTKIDSLLVK